MSNRRVTFFKEVKAHALMHETDSFHSLALAHDGNIYYYDSQEPKELWRRGGDSLWRERLWHDGITGMRVGKFKIKVQV